MLLTFVFGISLIFGESGYDRLLSSGYIDPLLAAADEDCSELLQEHEDLKIARLGALSPDYILELLGHLDPTHSPEDLGFIEHYFWHSGHELLQQDRKAFTKSSVEPAMNLTTELPSINQASEQVFGHQKQFEAFRTVLDLFTQTLKGKPPEELEVIFSDRQSQARFFQIAAVIIEQKDSVISKTYLSMMLRLRSSLGVYSDILENVGRDQSVDDGALAVLVTLVLHADVKIDAEQSLKYARKVVGQVTNEARWVSAQYVVRFEKYVKHIETIEQQFFAGQSLLEPQAMAKFREDLKNQKSELRALKQKYAKEPLLKRVVKALASDEAAFFFFEVGVHVAADLTLQAVVEYGPAVAAGVAENAPQLLEGAADLAGELAEPAMKGLWFVVRFVIGALLGGD